MPTLSPDVDFNVASEAPIAPVDYSGIARLVGDGITSATQAQEVDSGALDTELMRGLKKVRMLHDRGRSSEGHALESDLLTKYTAAGGNLGSPRIKTAVQGITGRDPEDFGNTPEEVALQETLKSDAYSAAVIGTYATDRDLTPEERREKALGVLSIKEGRAAILEQAAFNWTAEGEAALMGTISDFEDTIFGGAFLNAANGGELTLEDTQQAQGALIEFRRGIESRRPANVSNEEWSSVTKRLDQTAGQLQFFSDMASNENVGARAISDIQMAIKAADIDDIQKNWLLKMATADPQYLQEMSLFPSEVVDIMSSLQMPGDGGLTPGQLRDASITDPYPENNAKDMTSQQVFNNLNNISKGTQFTGDMRNNEDLRDAWGMATTMGLSNLNELAERGEWLTGEQYEKVFNEKFFEQLNSIKDTDPTLYDAVSSRAQRALTQTGNALQSRLKSVGAKVPADLDTASGEWILRPEGVRRSGVPPNVADHLIAAAVAEYGGDEQSALTAMMNEEGELFPGDRRSQSAYAQVMGDQEDNLQRVGQLTSSINAVLGIQGTLTDARGRPRAGDPEQSSRLLRLVDQKEGGGDYNTLFSHSQRGQGAFEGVNVSTMTLGELAEFSSTSGNYGNWVKEELRKAGKDPRIATPMGRYQIVGTTMREVAKEMGLSDSTVFTPAVQDAMFHHIARKALSGKTSAAQKRAAMRGKWEGFKTVSDPQLDRAIAEFEGSESPSFEVETRASRADVGGIGARIFEDSQDKEDSQATVTSSNTAPQVSVAPTPRPDAAELAVDPGVASEEKSEGERTASQVATEMSKQLAESVMSKLSDKDKRILAANGVKAEDLEVFASVEEAEKALADGEVPSGTVYVTGDGKVRKLEAE